MCLRVSIHYARGFHGFQNDQETIEETGWNIVMDGLEMKPTGTEARLCDLIAKRQAIGIQKYGKTLADNPLDLRQWLQHMLEELLDGAAYCQRAIEELDKRKDDLK